MSDHGDDARGWVLLLAQLPASPSSPRVTLWRRARAAGAVGLHNGSWVLPGTTDNEVFFHKLAEHVREHHGTAYVLRAAALDPDTTAAIVARFRTERTAEYAEFDERGRALLSELDKETAAGNFTFAELEENEQDLERLTGWLGTITSRDFFPDERGKDAGTLLEHCRAAMDAFTGSVYRAEGVAPDLPPDSGRTVDE